MQNHGEDAEAPLDTKSSDQRVIFINQAQPRKYTSNRIWCVAWQPFTRNIATVHTSDTPPTRDLATIHTKRSNRSHVHQPFTHSLATVLTKPSNRSHV